MLDSIPVVLLLLAGLAAANGANDVSKGVATLSGGGVTSYRRAVLWGTFTTAVGAAASILFAEKLTKLFSEKIFTGDPSDAYAVAVLAGALGWVLLATLSGLPVSTTQAIVGGLIGAGLLAAADAVAWGAVADKVVIPMVASVGVAFVVSFGVCFVVRRVSARPGPVCSCPAQPDGERVPALVSGPAPGGAGLALGASLEADAPGVSATAGSEAHSESGAAQVVTMTDERCAVHGARADRRLAFVNRFHWFSGAAIGFARGLNDTPKIVAVGSFALTPAGFSNWSLVAIVTIAMAAGGLALGVRVTRRMGEDIVELDPVRGCAGNLVAASLVGVGANQGLPLSTTQVTSGAIAGTAGSELSSLHSRTVRDFLIAWMVTPLIAGSIAAVAYLIVS
jgi:PiT family inorganic phosphate transporter